VGEVNFPSTHWSLLAAATLEGDGRGRAALATLCQRYRAPVFRYLCAHGCPPQESEDVTQDFFLLLLNSRLWKKADRSRGRFRTFIITVLTRVWREIWRRSQAAKRGHGVAALSLDQLMEQHPSAEPATGASEAPAAAAEAHSATFDREWAAQMMENACRALADEWHARGQGEAFAVLKEFLQSPDASYAAAGAQLGLTESGINTKVHRLRQNLREALRREVAQTVAAPHEVEEELRYLRQIMSET
jgi:DNA-directed RNA polymerase specialized sigma24 family protein